MRGSAYSAREFGLFIKACEPEMLGNQLGPNHMGSSERLMVLKR